METKQNIYIYILPNQNFPPIINGNYSQIITIFCNHAKNALFKYIKNKKELEKTIN